MAMALSAKRAAGGRPVAAAPAAARRSRPSFKQGRGRGRAGPAQARRATAVAGDDLPDPTSENTTCYNPAYFQPDWARHREHMRYIRHLTQWASTKVMRNCLPMTMLLTAGTAAIKAFAPATVQLPLTPFTLTSFVMALLLVFRTNSSYSRWWEARILWGGTVNNCRSLARETLCGMRTTTPHLCGRVLRMIVAYVYCLTAHLQGLSDANIRATLEEKCAPNEVEMLMGSKHRPGACLHAMGQVIRAAQRRGEIDNITHLYLAERVHTLTDGMGACERILRTTIPLSYTRHTSRFLTMWLGFLPFALVPQMGWVAVPTMFLTSLLLLGVDEIGVQIEEPFRRLPLKAISGVIEASVRGYLEEHDDMLPITEAAMPMNGAAAVAQPAISVA